MKYYIFFILLTILNFGVNAETLFTDNNPPIYLSLKLGGTTTFFNVGTKTKLTKREIENGEIFNTDGKKLLNLFGIDNKRFCTIFNPDVKTESGIVNGRPDANALSHLLESGIGFGYHVIHKTSRGIISKKHIKEILTGWFSTKVQS